MQHWKRITETANACFVRGELIDAREHYLQALAWAQVLFERWADVDEAVAACVISHHNLADLHLQLHQPEESAEYLCAIHERLLRATQDPRLQPALRDAARVTPARPTPSCSASLASMANTPVPTGCCVAPPTSTSRQRSRNPITFPTEFTENALYLARPVVCL